MLARGMVTTIVPFPGGNIHLQMLTLVGKTRMDNHSVFKGLVRITMKRRAESLLLCLGLIGSLGTAWAQVPESAPGRWRELPPEERRQMRQQMREHWQQEGGQRPEGQQRWRELPPEDRRQMREEMREVREQRGWLDIRHEQHGGRGWRRD